MARTRNRRRQNARRTVRVQHRRRHRAVAHNPRRRRQNVRHNRRRRNRRNPTRVVYVTRRHNRRHHNRRRNPPNILGVNLTSKSGMKLIGGGLVGVAGTKFLPTALPSSIFGMLGTSTLATTAISGFSAFLLGYLASRFDQDFGAGVYFGGFMQTLSVALNGFLPSVYTAIGSPLSGFGDFAPGRFAVPQNPLRMIPASNMAPAPTGSVPVQSGLGRAYWPAY